MKRKLLAVILLLSLLLGGCSLRLNSPEALIRPPKPYGKNKGLQEALEAGIGSKRYTLEAPVQGEYRSAYILFDIDGDKEEEALVFYRMGSSSNGQIKMNILDREDGKWVSKFNISGQGTDVNQVVFSYMSGKQVPEILVSWKLYDTQEKNLLSVLRCSYDSNHTLRMSSIQQMEYTGLAVSDLNKDGLDELLLLELTKNEAVPSAMATLYRMNDNVQLEKMGETKMDGSVTGYASVQVEDGYKISGNPRVYVDGLKGEAMMVTEILYWDEKEKLLRAPLYDAKTQAAMLMARSKNFTCRDINNDGILEIPRQYPMAGADILLSQEKEGVTLTQWVRLEEVTLVPVALTAVNAASFYMFTLPEQWNDMVYIKNDAESRTWTFYVWDHENQRLGQELLSIATVSKSSWSKKPLEGYTEIKVNQNLVYVAKIGQAQNLPNLTYQQVEANLQIFE